MIKMFSLRLLNLYRIKFNRVKIINIDTYNELVSIDTSDKYKLVEITEDYEASEVKIYIRKVEQPKKLRDIKCTHISCEECPLNFLHCSNFDNFKPEDMLGTIWDKMKNANENIGPSKIIYDWIEARLDETK